MPDADRVASPLAEIRAIEQNATPGPWIAYGIADDEVWSEVPWDHVAETMGNTADARFIAAARTAVPLLVAAIDAVLKLADEFEDEDNFYAAGRIRLAISSKLSGTRRTQPGEDGES